MGMKLAIPACFKKQFYPVVSIIIFLGKWHCNPLNWHYNEAQNSPSNDPNSSLFFQWDSDVSSPLTRQLLKIATEVAKLQLERVLTYKNFTAAILTPKKGDSSFQEFDHQLTKELVFTWNSGISIEVFSKREILCLVHQQKLFSIKEKLQMKFRTKNLVSINTR